MATTFPDNLRTPNAGDQYALTQDLGVLADTVQVALVKRGNLYIGTAAQRVAFTAATPGVNWQDTDGAQAKYARTSSGWLMLGEKFYSGTSAQRTAFSTAPNGSYWQDIDGVKMLWRRDATTWVDALPKPSDTGWVDLTSSVVTAYQGSMEGRRIGPHIDLRYTSAAKHLPTGNVRVATVPPEWRPSGTLAVRSGAYADPGLAVVGQLSASGEVNVQLPTGANRSFVSTSFFYTGQDV